MDGMCFDYEHYFPEETFIIDDFGEICEDVVRIAGANGQYLCKEIDAVLRRQESPPPPGSYHTSGRCFEKEVSSLFSEMEYLTEVSPGTGGVVLSETIAVNPTEFYCKRTAAPPTEPSTATEPAERSVKECVPEAPSTAAAEPESVSPERGGEQTHDNLSAPVEYQRILNNYIQKGRRKLEASSYSKMKASCPGGERWKAPTRSTSALEPSTGACSGSSTPITAIFCQPSTAKFDHTASIGPTVEMLQAAAMSAGGSKASSSAGLLKTTRLHHCRDCGLSYASSETLRRHSCIIAEQYQCHMCLREFKKRKTLDHHMKSHDKVFSTDDDLRK